MIVVHEHYRYSTKMNLAALQYIVGYLAENFSQVLN